MCGLGGHSPEHDGEQQLVYGHRCQSSALAAALMSATRSRTTAGSQIPQRAFADRFPDAFIPNTVGTRFEL